MNLFCGVRAEETAVFLTDLRKETWTWTVRTYRYQHQVNELQLRLLTQFALSARDLANQI